MLDYILSIPWYGFVSFCLSVIIVCFLSDKIMDFSYKLSHRKLDFIKFYGKIMKKNGN